MSVSANGQQNQISGKTGRKLRWLRLSGLQGKLIVPYVLLTLILASIGTFIVTRLVTSSFRERFVNQLLEASRVAADNIARRERSNLENLRLMSNAVGIGQVLMDGNVETLEGLLVPLALNAKVDIVTAVDTTGIAIATWGHDPASNQYKMDQGSDLSTFEPVKKVLAGSADAEGDKYVGVMETTTGPAIFTSAPVYGSAGQLVGVLMVGSRLETLLADTKSQALGDVVLLDMTLHLVATTLTQPKEVQGALEAAAQGADPKKPRTTDLSLYGRSYQIVYVPWVLRSQTIGWLGVVLPSNFVVAAEATSRNTFSLVFTLGTVGVIVVGYLLSRSIARPILRLRSMSQAVAAGDLNQNIGLHRSDEIGELANAFDVMTLHLRERTAETERLYAEMVQRNKELAEINARLQATQLQLIQSEKLAAVGQLTAGIVHDVKNPLAVIKGLAELLQGDASIPEETRKELKVIRESAEKANRIVSDLLKFARQATSEMRSRDIRETIEAALRLTAYLILEARIQLIKELPEQVVQVSYDAQQIEQVLINLIHNAIQAMPNRGTLRVSLTQNDGKAAISVEDTGTGISPENIKRIFDPFFTTKPEGQGTGLGLSVSYGIVANHQGSIEVQSEVGKGTTFTILLPADLVTSEVGKS